MTQAIKIYVVAGFQPLRAGLVNTISAAPGMEVLGEAAPPLHFPRAGLS